MSKGTAQLMGILFFCLLGIYISHPGQCGAADAKPRYLIKFATVAPEGSTWLKHMRGLDRDIREKSDGEMGFRIYAGGIAGDEIDVLKKIRIGQIHSAAFSGVGFGQILPMVRVLDLPFLFRSYEETDHLHRALQPFFTEAFKGKGFELLAWAEVGNVHLFSQKAIRRVKDLRGLKVWTWSGDPIAKATFSHMGVNPIPLSYPDVTTALNTGMIDTVYAPPLAALVLQWHASLTYMTALPLAHSTGAVLISSKYYETLPNGLASLLRNSFELAMGKLTDALRKQTSETMELMKNSGLTVVPRPSGDALGEFYEVHERVARDLAGDIYPEELLDRVYKNLERRRQVATYPKILALSAD